MKNVITFYAPYERIKEYASSPENGLHRSTIIQAITDITIISLKAKDVIIQQNAHRWFFDNGPDFQMVCDLADMEPNFVIKLAERALELMKKHIKN